MAVTIYPYNSNVMKMTYTLAMSRSGSTVTIKASGTIYGNGSASNKSNALYAHIRKNVDANTVAGNGNTTSASATAKNDLTSTNYCDDYGELINSSCGAKKLYDVGYLVSSNFPESGKSFSVSWSFDDNNAISISNVGFFLSSSSTDPSAKAGSAYMFVGKKSSDLNVNKVRYFTESKLSVGAGYTKCGTPSGVGVNKTRTIKDGKVKISWDKATDGNNNPVAGYRVFVQHNAAPTLTSYYGNPYNTTKTECEIETSASSGTVYHFKVQALGTREGWDSDLSADVTSLVNTPPTIEVGLTSGNQYLKSNEKTVSFSITTSDSNTNDSLTVSVKSSNDNDEITSVSNTAATIIIEDSGTHTLTFSVTDDYEISSTDYTIYKNSKPAVSVNFNQSGMHTQSIGTTSTAFYEFLKDTTITPSGSPTSYKWALKYGISVTNINTLAKEVTSSSSSFPSDLSGSLFNLIPPGNYYRLSVTPSNTIGTGTKTRTEIGDTVESEAYFIPGIPNNIGLINYNDWIKTNGVYEGKIKSGTTSQNNVYDKLAIKFVIEGQEEEERESFSDTSLSVKISNEDIDFTSVTDISACLSQGMYCGTLNNIGIDKTYDYNLTFTRGTITTTTTTAATSVDSLPSTIYSPVSLYLNSDLSLNSDLTSIYPLTSNSDFSCTLPDYIKLNRNIVSATVQFKINNVQISPIISGPADNAYQYTIKALSPKWAVDNGLNLNGENQVELYYQLIDAFGRVEQPKEPIPIFKWDFWEIDRDDTFKNSLGIKVLCNNNEVNSFREGERVQFKLNYTNYNNCNLRIKTYILRSDLPDRYETDTFEGYGVVSNSNIQPSNNINPDTVITTISQTNVSSPSENASDWTKYYTTQNYLNFYGPTIKEITNSKYIHFKNEIYLVNGTSETLLKTIFSTKQVVIQRHTIPAPLAPVFKYTPQSKNDSDETILSKIKVLFNDSLAKDNGAGAINKANDTYNSSGLEKMEIYLECVDKNNSNLLNNDDSGLIAILGSEDQFNSLRSSPSAIEKELTLINQERWEYCKYRVKLITYIGNTSKVWYSEYQTQYSTIPTLAYRSNQLGVNTREVNSMGILDIYQINDSKSQVRFSGLPDSQGTIKTAYINLSDLSLNGFFASGGEW